MADVAPEDVPKLRSLGPSYDPQLHARHAAMLLEALTDPKPTAARNIALAGHYGSGKSSVIQGVERELAARKVHSINLSMSSLGFNETAKSRVHEKGAAVPPLTNLIQKEIVKQLLYRKPPSDMRGSRYFRIDAFRSTSALGWAAVVGFFTSASATLLGLRGRIEKVGPQDYLAKHEHASWACIGLLGLFAAVVWFAALRTFQSRLRVESLSAGGAAITLQHKEHSYFDDYLDEIVYFFQQTHTTVAIFEDLDRFRDPYIFETLRELNTVLNNSEQIKKRPIRFVYAVRDSIFDQLELTEADVDLSATGQRAAIRETRPSTNRTKFFDLVIPMVPFLTHRSARDLVTQEFASASHQPSSDLVNLVGSHLTDMRLIRNVRNEFDVYRHSILGEGGLEGLSADRLIAMLVYKNLHLDDFEQIRLGTSRIDKAYETYRAFIQHQMNLQAAISSEALDKIRRDTHRAERAAVAGKRLQQVLPILLRASRRAGAADVLLDGKTYSPADQATPEFWAAFSRTSGPVQVTATNGYQVSEYPKQDLVTLLGPTSDFDELAARDEQRLRRQSDNALATRRFIATASMADALARADLTMPHEDGERSLAEVVSAQVSPMALELLATGYIDENFTLYCSDYHDVAISVAAMNFILHCVQPKKPDYRFRLDAQSVASVEAEMRNRFLNGESVFNVDVFNYYLATNADKIAGALGRLVTPGDPRTDFVDVYLRDGAQPGPLVEALMPSWQEGFSRIANSETLDDEAKTKLLDVALRHAAADVPYANDEAAAHLIQVGVERMPAFHESMDQQQAGVLAQTLQTLGVLIPELKALGPEQRQAVADRGLFPVTADNIKSVVQADSVPPLDLVRASAPAVYQHLLHHSDAYLDALEPGAVSVNDPAAFVEVINDSASTQPAATASIARRAEAACVVADVTDLVEEAREAVVSADRLLPTVANLVELARERDVSPHVLMLLRSHDLEAAEAVDEDDRRQLIAQVVNCADLAVTDRMRHVQTLLLGDRLDLDELTEQGLDAVPALVAGNMLEEGPETYQRLSARPYGEREALLAASQRAAEYVTSLDLTSSDLSRIFASAAISADTKKALLADSDYLLAHLDHGSAAAAATWANATGAVNPPSLAVLASKGAPAATVLDMLTDHLPTLDQIELIEILTGLGGPYTELTHPGRHHPKLPVVPGTEELLRALQGHGLVSSFRVDTPIFGEARYKVNMRVQ